MTPWDTIVAPTTPYGHSGVANIRISGSDSLNILSKLSEDEASAIANGNAQKIV